MTIYLLIFAFVVINYLATASKPNNSKFYWLIIYLAIALFVGLGDMLGGYDRYIYGALFDGLADARNAGYEASSATVFSLYGTELGYGYYNYLVTFITSNRYIFILISTLIIFINIYFAITRYSSNYALATIVFLGFMFFFTFTYHRQMLSAGIAWWAIKYLIERKPGKYIAIVALAAVIHNSALILLPVYLIPNIKFKPSIVVAALLFCLVLGFSGLPGAIYGGYGDIVSEQRAEGFTNDESGFRFEYVLEAIVIAGFILFNYAKIPSNNKKVIAMVNLAFIFCAILLVFCKSLNGGRIAWFFFIGLISTISYICDNAKKVNINSIAIISLCLVLYIRILFAWGVLLYPYKTFLTDGYREGDYIREVYEYDYNYDVDKFYR